MKIAIMQPYVFPYIGYFQLINAVDKFVFFDDVNFIKKGYINHNSILVNNEAYRFTIPCKNVSQNRLIKDVDIEFSDKERAKFLKTIAQSYKRAPHFSDVFPLLEQFIINNKSVSISEFAIDSIKLITDYLSIELPWILSSKNHHDSENLKKENRLISIAKKEKASMYINPIDGQNLYTKGDFESQGVLLNFLRSQPITYTQLGKEFVPSLSIIDVIMFNSIQETENMLNQYKLI